jgi:hypothetical protein
MGVHHLELYTLAYQGRVEKLPGDTHDKIDILIRELLETARETNLMPPESLPSKAQISKALMILGFYAESEECA